MAFTLPDKVLDTLICSFCHKYLSVKPITVYPNRDVECGRCKVTKNHKKRGTGVESLYGKIIETCLFKCINRFDGCRELLTYSQVLDHEKVCLEKIHKCPICHEEMNSFLMVRHFNSNHKDAILDCPAFVFNMNNYLEMPSIYLYQEEDNLFFLYIGYSKSENIIKLELVYMGSDKMARNIYHQFAVTSENKEFDIKFKTKPSHANEFSVVDASYMPHLINVKFKLFYQNLQFFTMSESVHLSLLKSSLENPWKQLVEFPSEYNPQCFNCKESCIFSFSDLYAVEYYYCPTGNDFLCFCCFQWLTHENKIIQSQLYVKQLIPLTVRKRFCKWNCGKDFKFSEILSHEISCKKRSQSYTCPIQDCRITKTHSENDHGCVQCFSLCQLTKLPMERYAFLEYQIVHFKLTKQKEEYNIECKIATQDSKIQSEWTPHVLFFYENTYTPLAKLPLSTSPEQCRAKIILMKN
uniref:Uncharacterized protein LOC114344354 n=1 Tax=Diabrotica virgifera virgifera TaxID=50390 RepID=A0A6P7GZU7_DIAVI